MKRINSPDPEDNMKVNMKVKIAIKLQETLPIAIEKITKLPDNLTEADLPSLNLGDSQFSKDFFKFVYNTNERCPIPLNNISVEIINNKKLKISITSKSFESMEFSKELSNRAAQEFLNNFL